MGELSLVSLAGESSYIPGPTNIGFVKRGDELWLIDSGNDKESAKKLLRLADAQELRLAGIINTHSNADHIGGNAYLQETADCAIWAPAGEAPLIEEPLLESAILWGGLPPKELRNKFFVAKPSRVTRRLEPGEEENGFRFIPLPGHFIDMMGVLSSDGVFYIGDAAFSPAILDKYKLPFIWDPAEFAQSLELVRSTPAAWYVPSHGEPCRDPADLLDANLEALDKAKRAVREALLQPAGFDDILRSLAVSLGIDLDMGQYALVGSTLRSLLASMREEGGILCRFQGGRLLWSLV